VYSASTALTDYADIILPPAEGKELESESPAEGGADETMDEEMKKLFDDLAARVAAIEDKMAPPKEDESEQPEDKGEDKEMSAKLDELTRSFQVKFDEQAEKIKLLENTAKPTTKVVEGKSRDFEKKLVGPAGF